LEIATTIWYAKILLVFHWRLIHITGLLAIFTDYQG